MSGPWVTTAVVIICALTIRRLLSCSPVRCPTAIMAGGIEAKPRGPAREVWLSTLIVAFASGVFFGPGLLAFGVGVGWFVLVSPVRRRIIQRRESDNFRNALPQFIEEMARGLRGGLSPTQALTEGAAVATPSFSVAFRSVALMLAAGSTASEAVRVWADRRNDPSVRFFATAMAVGAAVGGIDARSADTVAAALRERNNTEAIVRVQATQALYSAGVLCGAPVLFCALVVLTDQRSSAFLLSSPAGRIVGIAGVSLDVLGAYWMKRMVRQVVR